MLNSVFGGAADFSRKEQVLESEDNDSNPVSTIYWLNNPGKAPNFLEPQFLHLCSGGNDSTHFKALA